MCDNNKNEENRQPEQHQAEDVLILARSLDTCEFDETLGGGFVRYGSAGYHEERLRDYYDV